jgi:hypothetical protein
VTRQYPEIAAALADRPGGDLALDGEIVALDATGRPSFERLQRRMHLERDVARVAAAVPATAYFYDCLAVFGRDVRGLPLVERKELLRVQLPAPGAVRYAEHVDDGPRFLAAVCAAGLEGVVAKRADGPYRAGRHADWRKIKCHHRQEFVIGGWTDPKGTRARLGAVHVGFHDAGELVYAGRAGSGLGDAHLEELFARLRALAVDRCPFTRGAAPRGREHHWVRPSRLRGPLHRVDDGGCSPPPGLPRTPSRPRPGDRPPGNAASRLSPAIAARRIRSMVPPGTECPPRKGLPSNRNSPTQTSIVSRQTLRLVHLDDVMPLRLGGARDVARPLRVVEDDLQLGAPRERLQADLRLRPAERAAHAAEVERLARHRQRGGAGGGGGRPREWR